MTVRRPIRVLHVVRAMARGGVETWLMHLLRNLDPSRVKLDFLVHTEAPSAFDAEIAARGARILRRPELLYSPSYALSLTAALKHEGPYDGVHSHVHSFSGYLLAIARLAGVPLRIAHSHSDTAILDASANCARRAYLSTMKACIHRNATRLVAASAAAGNALFGDAWRTDNRAKVLHCAIDPAPFADAPGRTAARSSLNLRDDDFVIGHVGRFAPAKNHEFLLAITAEIVRRRPNSKLLLVGDGPLRKSVEQTVADLNLTNNVIFTGVRADVHRLLPAMDVFVFPSRYEGLPLTLLECQAAGLPCVVSRAITREVDIAPSLVQRVSLDHSAEHWADCVFESSETTRPANALRLLTNSTFNISHSVEEIYRLYAA